MKRILIGIFLVQFLWLGSVYALPKIESQYSADYEKIRNELQSKDLEIMEDAYRSKNTFLREISHPQATSMEVYLTDTGSGYGFFSPDSSKKELEEFIERTQSPETRMHSAERELVLGDAYHWLGHVYEEKGELTKAYECYVRSHVHYQKTPLQRSPRINQRLIVQEHGEFHLKDIISTISLMVTLPGFRTAICSSFF